MFLTFFEKSIDFVDTLVYNIDKLKKEVLFMKTFWIDTHKDDRFYIIYEDNCEEILYRIDKRNPLETVVSYYKSQDAVVNIF